MLDNLIGAPPSEKQVDRLCIVVKALVNNSFFRVVVTPYCASVSASDIRTVKNRGVDTGSGTERLTRGITHSVKMNSYPHTEVQLYVIHQIRNLIKYMVSKHHRVFIANQNPIHPGGTQNA